jgi:predicted ATP-grasp superfamily ATP-dependent carboligase
VPLPSSGDTQRDWVDWLLGEGKERHGGAVVLPCCDDGVELIARNRPLLVDDFVLAESNDEIALAMLDKVATYELARQVGVAAPRTWELGTHADLEAALPEMPFPCAIKPRDSHLFQRHFAARKLFVTHDPDEMRSNFDRLAALGLRFLATELIPGGDDQFCSYFTYLDERNQPLLHFTKHKLRQYPIHFGIGSYHISDHNPELADLGLRFFQGIGLRGMANVEFKRDSRDGKLKLIECNPRFSAANDLLARSGVDFSLFVYNRLTGRPLPPADHYRDGVRLIRPLEDFSAFVAYRRGGELSVGGYLASLCHRLHTPYFSWRDPWPSLAHGAQQLRYQLRRRILGPLGRALGADHRETV